MKIDITEIIQALLALISIIITSVIIPYIKNRCNEMQTQSMQKWVRIAVDAAEQIYKDSGMGQKKKEYVVAFLLSKGIVADVDKIEAMIEASVYNMTNALSAQTAE